MITKNSMSAESFDAWGWRVPFLISILMVVVSYFIRRNMDESPLFKKAKDSGKTSTNPLKESFGNKLNFKFVLLALFGVTMGQGVVWYTGQFYALSFLQKTCNIDFDQTNYLIAYALMLGTGFFIFFGWLSDKIGRKGIMMAGMLIAILTYRPIYDKIYQTSDIKNKTEIAEKTQITENVELKAGTTDSVRITSVKKEFTDGTTYSETKKQLLTPDVDGKLHAPEIKKATHLGSDSFWVIVLLIFIQVIYVTMVYGPVAAFLVEMFPTKIRYTSMSLPYHIGNGIFGGLLPTIATYLATNANSANEKAIQAGLSAPYDKPYLEGLWYPIIVAAVCFIIGVLYINGKDKSIED